MTASLEKKSESIVFELEKLDHARHVKMLYAMLRVVHVTTGADNFL